MNFEDIEDKWMNKSKAFLVHCNSSKCLKRKECKRFSPIKKDFSVYFSEVNNIRIRRNKAICKFFIEKNDKDI